MRSFTPFHSVQDDRKEEGGSQDDKKRGGKRIKKLDSRLRSPRLNIGEAGGNDRKESGMTKEKKTRTRMTKDLIS